ncbi:unnamed protein product [Lathyrus sativus]|nr:unnamed protein product [Lathyrus sativus]
MDYFILSSPPKIIFEFLQAVIRLFLKIHGETIRKHLHLQEKATKWAPQFRAWYGRGVDKLFQSTRYIIAFLSNSQIHV